MSVLDLEAHRLPGLLEVLLAALMAAGELVEPYVNEIGPPLVLAAALTSLAASDGL